jgi:hypothetical protein
MVWDAFGIIGDRFKVCAISDYPAATAGIRYECKFSLARCPLARLDLNKVSLRIEPLGFGSVHEKTGEVREAQGKMSAQNEHKKFRFLPPRITILYCSRRLRRELKDCRFAGFTSRYTLEEYLASQGIALRS